MVSIFSQNRVPGKDFSYPAKGDVYWNLSGGTNEITYDIFSEVFVDLLDESKGTVEKNVLQKLNTLFQERYKRMESLHGQFEIGFEF